MRYTVDTILGTDYTERNFPQLAFMDVYPAKFEMSFEGEYLLLIF